MVSVEEKIRMLERFLEANPGLASVPALMVGGRPATLSEALSMLRAGLDTDEILKSLQSIGLDGEEVWALAEEFWSRIVAARPDIRIYALQGYVPVMSPAEALEHIRARDEVGARLVQMYANMLSFIRERVDV
jgi:hypothetical protein